MFVASFTFLFILSFNQMYLVLKAKTSLVCKYTPLIIFLSSTGLVSSRMYRVNHKDKLPNYTWQDLNIKCRSCFAEFIFCFFMHLTLNEKQKPSHLHLCPDFDNIIYTFRSFISQLYTYFFIIRVCCYFRRLSQIFPMYRYLTCAQNLVK